MNRFLSLIIVTAVVVIALAYYQKWFQIGTITRNGTTIVTLSVDTDKVQADGQDALANVQDVGRQVKDKNTDPGEKTTDGTYVRFADHSLTMKDAEGTERRHPVAANVTLICDGTLCMRSDLTEGLKIRITVTTMEPREVTRIEAIKKNKTFASERHRDSTFVRATASEFVMANAEGKESKTHPLATNATITCDGKACQISDLKSGMRVRVSTSAKEPYAVTRIEALDRNLEFEKIF